jgi:hypothetical protein
MAPRWEPSSEKHGVSRQDQTFAIVNANFVHELDEPVKEGRIVLYIGPEHAQTDREVEVLVHEFGDGRESSIFHAMPLGPKFRRFREEHPDGWR